MFSQKGCRLVRERVARFALFDPKAYAALNEDVRASAADPLGHFVEHGLREGREFATSGQIAAVLASSGGAFPSDQPLAPPVEAQILKGLAALDIGVYVSSIGNFFMREIAEHTVAGLRALGARVSLLDERTSIAERPTSCIFVAPHEFFALGRGPEWAREDVVSSGFMYSTEQVQTPWFRVGLPYILACKGVVDLNFQSCALLDGAGIPTLFYFPGFDYRHASDERSLPDHPLARALPPAVKDYDAGRDLWADRPLDLVFIGTESPVRDDFLAQAAASFAKLSSFIHYVRLRESPILSAGPETRPALNRYVCRRAKIVLNIHQGEVRYFEWHRMVMQAMWQKALVVSDPCLPHPVFKPGVHYLEESRDRIPHLIDWLIGTADGRSRAERVRHEAFATLVEKASSRRMSLALAQFLVRHCG